MAWRFDILGPGSWVWPVVFFGRLHRVGIALWCLGGWMDDCMVLGMMEGIGLDWIGLDSNGDTLLQRTYMITYIVIYSLMEIFVSEAVYLVSAARVVALLYWDLTAVSRLYTVGTNREKQYLLSLSLLLWRF